MRPPFNPSEVVGEFAEVCRSYGISSVTSDRWGGEWVIERFKEHRIRVEGTELPKSDLYRQLLPLLNSAQIELLDHPGLIAPLLALEQRTSRGGRDHPPRGFDDCANAVAGVASLLPRRAANPMARVADFVGPRIPWPRDLRLDFLKAWNARARA